MSSPPWVIPFSSPGDHRLGIQVRHIQSGNDGDVCNSCVTHELLNTGTPVYCLDIGVDEGWWSFFVAETNPMATVIGFEPNPVSFEKLQKYSDSHIQFQNIAVSDRIGVLEMACEGGTSHTRGGSAETKSVICMPIDSYVCGRDVHCIKIDTEGHDLIVLRTLYPYLERIGSIIFEFSVFWYGENRMSDSIEVLYRLLESYPFMYQLSRRGNPLLTKLTKEVIPAFVESCERRRFQVDILVTRTEIKTIQIEA